MQFGHGQCDVYRVSIDYVVWTYGKIILGKSYCVRPSRFRLREDAVSYGDYD
jgi:hypothetical protein